MGKITNKNLVTVLEDFINIIDQLLNTENNHELYISYDQVNRLKLNWKDIRDLINQIIVTISIDTKLMNIALTNVGLKGNQLKIKTDGFKSIYKKYLIYENSNTRRKLLRLIFNWMVLFINSLKAIFPVLEIFYEFVKALDLLVIAQSNEINNNIL